MGIPATGKKKLNELFYILKGLFSINIADGS
jgi:hypothetical protein